MGLFSKRKDEMSGDTKERHTPLPEPAPESQAAPAAPEAAVASPSAAVSASGPFGIRQAMDLLEAMPPGAGSPKAYMGVVKKTLEAVGVSVEQIVADGERRSGEIVSQIGALQAEVQSLEEQTTERKRRVTELQAELEEISSVQERFRADTDGGLASPRTGDLGLTPRER